jgi:hypothetical protein
MPPRIHFFALADSYPALLFCGDFRDGDGWTALPHGVTCPECKRRVEAMAGSMRPPSGLTAEHAH